MPVTKDKDYVDPEALSETLMVIAQTQQKLIEKWSYRIAACDKLEDEVIALTRTPGLRIPEIPSLSESARLMAVASNLLGQIAEIEAESVKVTGKLTSNQVAMTTSLQYVLGQSGTADTRRIRAEKAMEGLNLMLQTEKNLQAVCETAKKQMANVWSTASRQQGNIEIEVKHFGVKAISEELQHMTPQWK